MGIAKHVRPLHCEDDVGRDRRAVQADARPAAHNVCSTDPIDVVNESDGKRDFVRMRWGLVPWWWSKPLKELRAATFNARAELVETKPFFRRS